MQPFLFPLPTGMLNGNLSWCSGVVAPAYRKDESNCNLDCVDDPVGNKRKCGGGGNYFSTWKLEKEYCPFKSNICSFTIMQNGLKSQWVAHHDIVAQ